MALQDNNLILLDAQGFQRTIDPASDSIGIGVDTDFGQDVSVGGNLTVTGDIISGGTMDVVVSDNFIDLSNGQGNAGDKSGGLTVNVKASVARVVNAGGNMAFTNGNEFAIPGWDPSTGGVGGGTLAAGDIIEIAGAADLAGNNGLFVVLSVAAGAGGKVTINGAVQVQSPWAQTAFENGTETTVTASLAPAIDLGVLCISDGALLDIGGNPIPVGQFVSAFDTAAKISTLAYEAAANVSLQEAYNVGQQIIMADAQGNLEIRTDDTGTRADFRLTNQGATADYLLSAAGLLTVGSGSTNKVAMSGQLTTDLVFDGVGARHIQQTGQSLSLKTLTSGDMDIISAGAMNVTATALMSIAGQDDVNLIMGANSANPQVLAVQALNAGAGDGELQLGAKSLVNMVTTAGAISISATGGDTIVDSTSGSAQLNAPAGLVSSTANGTWAAQGGSDVSITSTGGKVLATSNGDMDLVAGGMYDLNATSGVEIDAAGAGFSIDSSAGNSNVTATGGSLTVATATSGNLSVTSADAIIGGAVNNIGLTSSAGQVNTNAATSSTFSSVGAMEVNSSAGNASVIGNGTLSLTATTAGFALLGQTGSSVVATTGALAVTALAGDVNAVASAQALVQGLGLTARATGAGMAIDHQHAGSILTIASAGAGLNAVDIDASAGGVDISGAAQVTVTSTNNVELNASGSLFLDGANDSRLKSSAGDILVETANNAKGILLKTAAASTSTGTSVEGYLNLSDAQAGVLLKADGVGVTAGDVLFASDLGAGSIVGKASNSAQATSRVIGVAVHSAGAGANVHGHTIHGATVMSALGAQAAADVGKEVFLGAAGAMTLTAPTASGSTVYRVGYLASTNGMIIFAPQMIAYRP
jgi:hypothetical protein